MRLKRISFTIVLIMPALLLVSMAFLVARDVHEVRSLRPGRVAQDLRDHLLRKEPESFPPPDELFRLDPAKKTAFLFGESSLVLSDGGTFPDYLGRRSDNLQTVNFGVSGIDSFSVRLRVAQALAEAHPNVIILYYGHNDYNNAYNGFIIPTYFPKFDALIALPYLFHDRDRPEGVILSDTWYWYSRLTRPRIIRAFERMRLLDIRSGDYEQVNELILEHFMRNTEAILAMAASRHIPVVVITPVGNLRAEPFGDLGTTTELYRRGMAESDYLRSLSDLKAARDTELFTYDIRAKTPLLDYLRSLKRPGVYVLDLERRLEEMHFGFGYGEFLDYFHFNDRSHRLIADIIYTFMAERKLTGAANDRQQPGKRP